MIATKWRPQIAVGGSPQTQVATHQPSHEVASANESSNEIESDSELVANFPPNTCLFESEDLRSRRAGTRLTFGFVEVGIQGRVVVHFELAISPMSLATGKNIGKQLL